ncbi:carcinine hydrolase/isopenicillin-N N-acyltransferase family protein [Erysipelotrichaceae bacterium HCN-30851]
MLLIPTEETNQTTDKVDITTTTAIRMILDKCANVKEAIELLSQYDMHSSANSCYHFQIADANGDSVVVEYINNEMKLVKPEKAYQAATNFLLTPGAYDFGHGQDRYNTLMTTLEENNGVLSEQEAMDLLNSVSQQPHKTDSGSLSSTQWSVVYNNTKLTATISMGMDYEHTYKIKLFE